MVSFISFGFGSISYMYRKTSKNLLIFITYLFGSISFMGIYYTAFTQNLVVQVEKDGSYWLSCQVLISTILALMVLALVRLKPQSLNLFYKTGQFSYTLYIAHFPIVLFIYFILAKLFPIYLNQNNVAITSSLSFIFALLFSLVLARLIEQPKLQRQLAIQVIQNITNSHRVRDNKDTNKQNRR
jgi:peptidoglycan/LPS O-acetylase OafA/YrhL